MPDAMSFDFTPSPLPSLYDASWIAPTNALESNGHVGVMLQRLHPRQGES